MRDKSIWQRGLERVKKSYPTCTRIRAAECGNCRGKALSFVTLHLEDLTKNAHYEHRLSPDLEYCTIACIGRCGDEVSDLRSIVTSKQLPLDWGGIA